VIWHDCICRVPPHHGADRDPDYEKGVDDTTTNPTQIEGGPPRTLKPIKHSSVKTCNTKVFVIFVCAVISVLLGCIISLVGETTAIYFGIAFLALGALLIVFSSFLARCLSDDGEETM